MSWLKTFHKAWKNLVNFQCIFFDHMDDFSPNTCSYVNALGLTVHYVSLTIHYFKTGCYLKKMLFFMIRYCFLKAYNIEYWVFWNRNLKYLKILLSLHDSGKFTNHCCRKFSNGDLNTSVFLRRTKIF